MWAIELLLRYHQRELNAHRHERLARDLGVRQPPQSEDKQ